MNFFFYSFTIKTIEKNHKKNKNFYVLIYGYNATQIPVPQIKNNTNKQQQQMNHEWRRRRRRCWIKMMVSKLCVEKSNPRESVEVEPLGWDWLGAPRACWVCFLVLLYPTDKGSRSNGCRTYEQGGTADSLAIKYVN